MARIGIFDIYTIDLGTFLHALVPTQAQTIWGGFPYLYIKNVSDAVNDNSVTYEYDTVHDSRFRTVDYSRSNYTFGSSWITPWFY
jgi:hypothetical protein